MYNMYRPLPYLDFTSELLYFRGGMLRVHSALYEYAFTSTASNIYPWINIVNVFFVCLFVCLFFYLRFFFFFFGGGRVVFFLFILFYFIFFHRKRFYSWNRSHTRYSKQTFKTSGSCQIINTKLQNLRNQRHLSLSIHATTLLEHRLNYH